MVEEAPVEAEESKEEIIAEDDEPAEEVVVEEAPVEAEESKEEIIAEDDTPAEAEVAEEKVEE